MYINENISIELLHSKYSEELFGLTESNRTYLRKWLPWLDFNKTVQDTEKFIESTIIQYQEGLGPQYAVFYKDKICGVNGFHRIDKINKIGILGFWLDESYTGKGIISLTTRKLLNIGFYEYKLNKIEIRCASENHKSRTIPERLGFKYEATLRQCEFLYNKYVDHAVYSLLSTEYNLLETDPGSS